jgi:glucose/mannose transport system substrate-binding protein
VNNQRAQGYLASAVMSPQFQNVFNVNKGSIPVRVDLKMDDFDDCGKLSAKDFLASSKSGGLVPSIAHGMAIKPAAEGAIKDFVSSYWNDDKMTVADAKKKLLVAAKTK